MAKKGAHFSGFSGRTIGNMIKKASGGQIAKPPPAPKKGKK